MDTERKMSYINERKRRQRREPSLRPEPPRRSRQTR